MMRPCFIALAMLALCGCQGMQQAASHADEQISVDRCNKALATVAFGAEAQAAGPLTIAAAYHLPSHFTPAVRGIMEASGCYAVVNTGADFTVSPDFAIEESETGNMIGNVGQAAGFFLPGAGLLGLAYGSNDLYSTVTLNVVDNHLNRQLPSLTGKWQGSDFGLAPIWGPTKVTANYGGYDQNEAGRITLAATVKAVNALTGELRKKASVAAAPTPAPVQSAAVLQTAPQIAKAEALSAEVQNAPVQTQIGSAPVIRPLQPKSFSQMQREEQERQAKATEAKTIATATASKSGYLYPRPTDRDDGIKHFNKGDEVLVTGWTSDGKWLKARFADREGFVKSEAVTVRMP